MDRSTADSFSLGREPVKPKKTIEAAAVNATPVPSLGALPQPGRARLVVGAGGGHGPSNLSRGLPRQMVEVHGSALRDGHLCDGVRDRPGRQLRTGFVLHVTASDIVIRPGWL
jgi:hypothetical protein